MNNYPPKWAVRFLRWFCREDFIDEIEGDLLEMYRLRSSNSIGKAKLFFVWNVLRSLRWMNLKKSVRWTGSFARYRNYFTVGSRALRKDWKFSLLNTLGLSIGIAVFIVMIMLVDHEQSFDRFHSKGERIFQVIQNFTNPEGEDPEIWTSLNLSAALKSELAMVENAVSVHSAAETWATVAGERFFEADGIVAGPEFLEIFDFQLMMGNRSTALEDKSRSIIISESKARKYFGDRTDILGELVALERYGSFRISGVMKDLPSHSTIQFDYVITQNYDVFFEHVAPWFPSYFTSWKGDPSGTYVLLKEAGSASEFGGQVEALLKKHIADPEDIYPHYLINLFDLHFDLVGIDGRLNEFVKGDRRQVTIISWVAGLILLMACFNYINLTTSRSLRRSKEVGVRKSIGATRGQLSSQFLTESLVMVLISLVISFGWMAMMLPYFQEITGIQMDVTSSTVLRLSPSIALTLLAVTFLAGFYPAIYLGRFSAIKVLKNMTHSVKGNVTLRNGLVFIQYSLVLALLAALIIVSMQYTYFQSKALGFETKALVIVEVNGAGVRSNFETIKDELLKNSQIEHVTGLTRMISGYRSGIGVFGKDLQNPEERYGMRFYGMDQDGFTTLGLTLVSGSYFQGAKGIDSTTVFLNEQAARLYGGDKVVGEIITIEDEDGERQLTARVGGIVKDFHYRSLHDPIGPVVVGHLFNPLQGLDDIVIKVRPSQIQETLSYIEEIHHRYDENDVMTWEFMDDMIQRSYEREATYKKILSGAAGASLVIVILGLVGMIAYNVTSRTKEIGIRKVFGASFIEILKLQGRSSAWLLFLAASISLPAIYYLGEEWLSNYAFRVTLALWPFLMVTGLLLLITIGLVVVLNYRIARENPVQSIRYE